MSRSLRLLSIVCVLVVFPIQPAKACSCAYGDPRDMFERADGAFVGTFVESHPVDPTPTSSDADTVYTFVLDEEHKGELGEPGDLVEVHAPLSGASCGLETQTGEQYGIFLYAREDGLWESNLCSQVSPQTLREGASPLPAPTSDGPVRMVAGGSFGDSQTIFLDGRGETVGYGHGDREVTHVDGCPGGARTVEASVSYPGRPVLHVRDVSSGEVVRSVDLPVGEKGPYRGLWVGAIECLGESGWRSVVFATNDGGSRAKSVLLAVDGTSVDVAHEGTARAATLAGAVAYLQDGRSGRRLTRVSLRDGEARSFARLPGDHSSELVLSPDRTRLAGVSYPSYERMDEEPALVFTVALPGGRIRTKSLGTGERDAHVSWLSRARLAMFVQYPDASRVFDLRLRVQARFGRWEARSTAIVGDTAYGVDYEGRLLEVELPDGTPLVARRLPSPVVFDLVALP